MEVNIILQVRSPVKKSMTNWFTEKQQYLLENKTVPDERLYVSDSESKLLSPIKTFLYCYSPSSYLFDSLVLCLTGQYFRAPPPAPRWSSKLGLQGRNQGPKKFNETGLQKREISMWKPQRFHELHVPLNEFENSCSRVGKRRILVHL